MRFKAAVLIYDDSGKQLGETAARFHVPDAQIESVLKSKLVEIADNALGKALGPDAGKPGLSEAAGVFWKQNPSKTKVEGEIG